MHHGHDILMERLPPSHGLQADDRLRLLEALEALGAVETPQQLRACLDREVERAFPHGMLACQAGRPGRAGAMGLEPLFLHRFPGDLLACLDSATGTRHGALLDRWLATRQPVLINVECGAGGWPWRWPQGPRRFPLPNLAMHAVCDIGGQAITTFCFAAIPRRLDQRHEQTLRLLVPCLYTALERSLRPSVAAATAPLPVLTGQQQELLRWIQLGKTNAEIALILGMTHSNVKYHLRQVYKRLNVCNRAQAIGRLLEPRFARAC